MSTTVAELVAHLDDARLVGPLAPSLASATMLVDATHDSRAVTPQGLFCAVVGAVADGHDHAAEALQAGAGALLVQRPLDLAVAQIQVPDTRVAVGPAAALVHGNPSHDLTVVGVTGTNGKTTTSYLLEHAFAADGRGVGVIGTIESRVHGEALTGVRTTPEGTDLQRLLRRMHDRGVDAVAMEASSHGMALHRVDGIEFAVALFLNLTQDHLDFHPDMDDYFRAKARLFTMARRGAVCIEDEWGRRLATELPIPVVTFGRPERCGDAVPDVAILDLVTDATATTLTLDGPDGRRPLRTNLLGDVNGINAAAAWVAATQAGVDGDVAATGVAGCPGVPGRLEPVPNDDVAVLVDYAHTPDAVEQVVRIARGIAGTGRVLIVIGCGGDRDRTKRGPMGAAAARADVAVLTSDNPRSEDPAAILEEMFAGAVAAGTDGDLIREIDRQRAIEVAIEQAKPGDVVVIAGKGHETGQTFADRTVPFDDRQVASEALRSRSDA